ncbi:MAG: 50S ribosomal protein L31 [Planctomycetes bacterium]|nr:50S ribosomal protein L31 [Planctomycetota bacterium]
MKKETHPKWYPDCKVNFRGQHVLTVGATVPEMNVEVWSGSHPFYTGQKSFVDTLGRVERFQKKFAGEYFKKDEKPAKEVKAPAAKENKETKAAKDTKAFKESAKAKPADDKK